MKIVPVLLLLTASQAAIASDLQPKAAHEVLAQISAGFDSYMNPAVAQRTQPALKAAGVRLAAILDLRGNRGGGGISDEALLGHLSHEPIPMVSILWRNPDGSETVEQRRLRAAPGRALYADKPVFVLTSGRTFSAAEEFAYDLKAAGRATLIGETKGGGANPANRPVLLSYGCSIFIPNGKVTHLTTGTNWEGAGIAPDVAVPADQALTEAYSRALKVAKPMVTTPQTEAERTKALSDPKAALLADQSL